MFSLLFAYKLPWIILKLLVLLSKSTVDKVVVGTNPTAAVLKPLVLGFYFQRCC